MDPDYEEVLQVLEVIEQASSSYDKSQLPFIRPYLYHPRSEVREAARQGIVNLGEVDGAQLLRAAANSTIDREEKDSLLQMAEYLELPPLPVNIMPPFGKSNVR